MPGKKKKGKERPEIHPKDSMIRDIEAAKKQNLQAISSNESIDGAEDGLDVAGELMATLAARDRAAISVEKAGKGNDSLQVPDIHHHAPHKSKSDQSATSGHSGESSSIRGPGEMLIHAGEKIFGGHHSKSPPPINSPDSARSNERLASDMQRKGSIRERIFGASPSSRDDTTGSDGRRQKVSRQQARKVGVLFSFLPRLATADTMIRNGTETWLGIACKSALPRSIRDKQSKTSWMRNASWGFDGKMRVVEGQELF